MLVSNYLFSQDLPSYIPTDGLVAYYPFNGNANDESGNGNHGTVNGATLTTDRDGNENSVYSFDGVDDYIFLGKNSDFPISNSFSISVIFLIQDVNCKNDSNNECDNIIYNNEGLYELGINKNNSKLKFSINNSEPDWGWIDIEFDYDFEKWNHLIFNYDDGLIKIFINNSSVYIYDGVGGIIKDVHQDLDEFRLGNRQLGDVSNGNHFFTGKIDDFGIWNRALTEQEIQNLYNSSSGDILLNGTVSIENNQIKNVADPTHTQDAVTLGLLLEKISNLQEQIDALKVLGSGTVIDQNGNSYPYLTYGDQVWTVRNAEMATYRDGTKIPQVTDATQWANLTTGAWAYYDNDPTKGKLYNWYAVMGIHDTDPNTPNKEFAPEGWHVPTDVDWTAFEEHLRANGYNYDGTTTGYKIAKAMASTTGWSSSTSTGAVGNVQSLNNSSGFNAFPEGGRASVGSFHNEGSRAFFWSSTEFGPKDALDRSLIDYYGYLISYFNDKRGGFSVRFVRD